MNTLQCKMTACFMALIFASLAVPACTHVVLDSDLLYAAPTESKRYELVKNLSLAWKGQQLRAVYVVPDMEHASQLRINATTAVYSDSFLPAFGGGNPNHADGYRLVRMLLHRRRQSRHLLISATGLVC